MIIVIDQLAPTQQWSKVGGCLPRPISLSEPQTTALYVRAFSASIICAVVRDDVSHAELQAAALRLERIPRELW